MVANSSSSRPSKPGVVGPSPTGHTRFPSEKPSGRGSKKLKTVQGSPDRVPTELNGRAVRTATTKDIRSAVCRRADGKCEACEKWVGLHGEDAHLDHRFGRGAGRPPESVENCWLLCIACDGERTKPSRTDAGYWWGRFILHAQRYGFTAEALLADNQLEWLRAKGLVSP